MKSPVSQNFQNKRILAVHGFTGEPYDFSPLYESDVIHADWRFVTLPGHYREMPVENCSAEQEWKQFCSRVDEIVNEAAEDAVELVGLGYSMGARLLLRAQLQHGWDFHRMVLVGMNPGIEDEQARTERWNLDKRWASMLSEEGIESFINAWMQQPIIASQANADSGFRELRIQRKLLLQPGPLARALLEYSNGKLEPVWEQLDQLQVPVDLVTGESDQKFTAIHERAVPLFGNGSCCKIPRSGHAPHMENTESFAKFLAQQLSS